MNEKVRNNEEVEIDLLRLLKLLWKKAWIIGIAMILCGAIALGIAAFFISPTYESSAQLYVNNANVSLGGTSFSISTSELTAAKSLLQTYIVILKTRVTLERVNEVAGLGYTYAQLRQMVSASSVDNTEIFSVDVTSKDPTEAKRIADTIVDILPDRISEIVAGSSVRIVDYPVQGVRKGPSYTRYAVIGLVIGFVLSAAVIIIIDLLDTTVRDEEYLDQRFDIPVLAVIPDANESSHSKGYGKYGKYYYKNYAYHGRGEKSAEEK